MIATFQEVINLTEDEATLPLHNDGGCIFSQELELSALPPLGKITTPDSEVDGLLKTLPRAINFTDYFQKQISGGCGLVSVNNLVGSLNEGFLNGIQKTLQQSQPNRAHHYVCSYFELSLTFVERIIGDWLACCSFVCSLYQTWNLFAQS
jgi:hypothetical protein